jgi:hypothetical protein
MQLFITGQGLSRCLVIAPGAFFIKSIHVGMALRTPSIDLLRREC